MDILPQTLIDPLPLLDTTLAAQVMEFHEAIMDALRRARQPDVSDAMAVRLRNNAASLFRAQRQMILMLRQWQNGSAAITVPLPVHDRPEQADAVPSPATAIAPEAAGLQPARRTETAAPPQPAPVRADRLQPERFTLGDHMASGDALARFTSRRIDLAQPMADAWAQAVAEADVEATLE